jgi:hypothetical protein
LAADLNAGLTALNVVAPSVPAASWGMAGAFVVDAGSQRAHHLGHCFELIERLR